MAIELAFPPRLRADTRHDAPTIGVAFPGDVRKRATWSGTPAGLVRGLTQAGVAVVPIHAEPPLPLNFVARNAVALAHLERARRQHSGETVRLARRVARASPPLASCYTWAARRRLRNLTGLDGVIQIGTGYLLPEDVRVVTFEDITIIQSRALGYPEWKVLSEAAVSKRIARQAHAYEHAVACCATTHWAADSIINDYGVPPEKVHAVGVGRNHDPHPQPRDWSRPRFLFVGRDWEGKNGPGLMRAFSALRREVPDARLDVVGNHPPIDAAGATGHGALPLNNGEARRQVERLFQSATCFVLPSHYEASAIAFVEAAAAGLPCIATAAGGSRDLVGAGGRIVDPADDSALLAAMRELCDPATAKRLGAIALRRAELFTWRRVAERILRALALPAPAVQTLADFL